MSYREINYQELYNKEKDKVLNLEKELSKFKGENYTLTSKIRNANLKINELDAKMPKFDNKKDIIVDKIILTLALLFLFLTMFPIYFFAYNKGEQEGFRQQHGFRRM